MVEALCDGALRRCGPSSPAVPSLLGGLLAEAPVLSAHAVEHLTETLAGLPPA